jgi:predicted RNA-binding Zn ribbon-like protein
VELSNTIYAVRGNHLDGIADPASLKAWLAAVADQLPVDVRGVEVDRLADFHALRTAVRDALHASVDGKPVAEPALAELNRRSAGNPQSIRLIQRRGKRESAVDNRAQTTTDVVLGAIAAETIALLSGAQAHQLRACEAPGCVLMFLKDHPRREWCSTACGNRARQARHYRRHRQHAT